MNTRRSRLWFAVLIILSMLLAACGGSATEAPSNTEPEADESAEAVTIRYTLWDANQLPAYEQCAIDFMAQNPNIQVEITQSGWGDYWNDLQTSMVAGTAPDVFTNHLAKYPEFASKQQLIDIQPYVESDGVDTGIYIGDLADLWTRDGRRFGLPKDWDTIAVVYNKDMFEAAGVDPEVVANWTWNPADGGTFQQVMAQVTLDETGNNGLSDDFDATKATQYGLVADFPNMGAYGQTQWSHFAVSNGWSFVDGMYSTKYHYDDPKFAETMQWMADMTLDKGYLAPYEITSGMGANALFTSQQAAMIFDGSWMIGFYAGNTNFEVGFARLPIGPAGRKSMFNGLADSIWVGTEHPEEAWEWVKYAASPACENVVGEYGVVFPAVETGVNNALQAFENKGLDVSAYTDQALEEGGTFLFPVTDNASKITSIMQETMDSMFLGTANPAEALKAANEKVNATFTE